MKRIIAGGISLLLAFACSGYALERNANIIDSIEAVYREYDQMEVVGVRILGEQQLPARDDWSVVFELGWGQISHVGTGSPNMWAAGLGFKKYIEGDSSFTISGGAEWAESGDDFSAAGLGVAFEHRFEPAEAAISPYAEAEVGITGGKSTPWTGVSDDFTAGIVSITVGCDFLIGDDVALMVNASLNESFELSGGPYAQYADGWSGGIGLRYFWGEL